MKRGTPDHPKVYELCERLGCDRPTAIGYLEMLWHFTARYAPRGNIGNYSDARIERALDWFGRGRPAGKLIRALVEAGWIEVDAKYRLKIHDWKDHADEAVRIKLKRAGLYFVDDEEKVSGQVTDMCRGGVAHSIPTLSRLPEPEPEPEPKPMPLATATTSYRNGSLPRPVSRTSTADAPESHTVSIVRCMLHEYVTHLCHLDWPPPDDDICTKVLLAAGGELEELQQKLIVLWKQKHAQPSRSYAWFISAIRSVK